MPELNPPRILKLNGNHSVRVTHEASVGCAATCEIVSPAGKVRRVAQTITDACTIAQLCDRLYRQKKG